MSERFDVLGVLVSAVNLEEAVAAVTRWVGEARRTYVCVAPVSTIVDCRRDERYRRIVNASGMTTPDGMPVVWLGRRKGHKTVRRTYGPDLMHALCAAGLAKGTRHFFYGGTPETLGRLTLCLKERYPGIVIAGSYAPPMRGIGERETPEMIAQMNAARPDILWVGLGSPKQDFWMSAHRDVLSAPVLIGVGAAFDFLAGVKPQAPLWMRRSGLEWLFRLGCEPGRLWRRYLIGNTLFLYWLVMDSFKKKA